LDGENRVLVKLGMEVLSKWERPGWLALREASGLNNNNLTARNLCYSIIPRLNSTGRISSAREAVRLLSIDDVSEAREIARKIEEKNRQRKSHDSVVTREASYLADIMVKRNDPAALVFSSSSWHEGVVGIGASRLAEKYNKPTALIAVKGKLGKGSIRSSGMVNVKEVMERCSRYLVEFGGHKEAGGFTIAVEDIPEFQVAFEEMVSELSKHQALKEKGVIFDVELGLSECTLDMISFIESMEPFGPKNREPLFLLRGLKVLPGSRVVGNGHLKLLVDDIENSGCDLIGFSMADRWPPHNLSGNLVDVLAYLRRDCYRGEVKPQIEIRDIRYSDQGV
jgi:single-stranded-DNA-specific exonuclease